MAGKYSKLKGSMVKFQQPQDWQDKVNVVKGFLGSESKTELTLTYNELRDEKDKLSEREKEINVELEAISQLMVERLEEEGISSFKTTNGITMFIKDEPYVSASDKHALHNWIKEQGMEDIFSVNYQTLSAITKEKILKGEEPPPGVSVFMKSSINRRKAN